MSEAMHEALLGTLPEMQAGQGWQILRDETFIGHIGSVYTRPAEGCDELAILTRPIHRNLSGGVHGGILMSLFDRAMGWHVRGLHPGESFATASMTVEFVRPIRVGDFVRIRPVLTKDGRKAVFIRAEAQVGEKMVGAATATFLATG